MKRLNFKCTLLTDVVISAHTATEGEHQSLNFIPGSNFLGILASEIYKSNPEDCYSLFHSGKVRFGDAHIIFNDKRAFQVPFSWYYPKGGSLTENKNYMLNFMSNGNFNDLISGGIQLKQAREGYFIEEGIYLSPAKLYSQKSAHDSDNRRSAESKMFGYEALQKGSVWQFCIDVDDDLITENKNILKELKALVGTKRLGRSKTAEFGTTLIELLPLSSEPIEIKKIKPKQTELEKRIVKNGQVCYKKELYNLVLLYAESRLAFRDVESGQPTFVPTSEQLGLPKDAEILWERSQIRTGVYAPWNWKRDCRDEDRLFIEKGSVFVVDFGKIESFTDEIIINGVGLYKTEGFGKLLINPAFLDLNPVTGLLNLQLNIPEKPTNKTLEPETPPDHDLIKWIKQQNDLNKLMEMVDDFIKAHAKKFNKVTSSQWGNIRSHANGVTDKNDLLRVLFESPDGDFKGGFLTHGTELKQWEDGNELLEQTIKATDDKLCLPFISKLAAKMQKKGGNK